jgi:hypothetical protein
MAAEEKSKETAQVMALETGTVESRSWKRRISMSLAAIGVPIAPMTPISPMTPMHGSPMAAATEEWQRCKKSHP